ncbi:hypothetical protein VTJ04DRAFT_10018 [Mycothermus thermophilus]|uniref:uncharacterized protein n=1 Tax=Humicola insolens TaxID=85995 RepID=UPI00374301DC
MTTTRSLSSSADSVHSSNRVFHDDNNNFSAAAGRGSPKPQTPWEQQQHQQRQPSREFRAPQLKRRLTPVEKLFEIDAFLSPTKGSVSPVGRELDGMAGPEEEEEEEAEWI